MSDGKNFEERYNKLRKIIGDAVEYFNEKYIAKRKNYYKRELSAENNNGENSNHYAGIVRIFSHIDADGITAASIIAIALRRKKIPYQVTLLKQMEERYIKPIAEYTEKLRQFPIFTDFGSGQLNLFREYMKDRDFIILDHHEILEKEDEEYDIKGFHANPYMADIDGSREICGAGMAYLFAKEFDPINRTSSMLAVIGAIGDIQTVGVNATLIGVNAKIAEDAVEQDLIEIAYEPAMNRSKSLPYALAYTFKLKVPGITDDFQTAARFLEEIGIRTRNDFGEYRTLGDLNASEKKKLLSSIIQRKMISDPLGYDPEIEKQVVATVYLLKPFKKFKEVYDARDFATILNATGRLGKQSLGLRACILATPTAINDAIKVSEEYVDLIKEILDWIKNDEKIVKRKNIQSFYGENKIPDTIVGVICTKLLGSDAVDPDKPIIGYSNSEEGFLKLSARCKKGLVEKGVNLSTAIREVCGQMGIKEKGGGHPPASGAKIPAGRIDEFLRRLDEVIGKQLTNG